MIWRVALLVFGVFTGATAVIMIKNTDVDPVLLAGCRQILAALVLLPLFFRHARKLGSLRRNQWKRTILPGVLLGTHFVTWIAGARMTPAANSSLIVNMLPIVMPFLMYFMVHERLTRGEFLGTAVAVVGMAVLAVADFNISAEFFRGDALCFLSLLFLAGYMALGRRNRDFPSLWMYVTPVYLFGGVTCLAAAGLADATGLRNIDWPGIDESRDVWMILGLALVPTIMGHTIYNYSMQYIRGQIVSLVCLGQFVFAGIMGATALLPEPEFPPTHFYIASVCIVAGAVIALRATPHPVDDEGPAAELTGSDPPDNEAGNA